MKTKKGSGARELIDTGRNKMYARRDGKWQYLSHRTVDGPVYEKD